MSTTAVLRGVCFVFWLMAGGVAVASVTISPSTNQTINENATVQFKASVASKWTASCGAISSAGLYRAGLYPETCTITAKATSGGSTASVKVTVVSPITMSPVGAMTPEGQTQQFTASAPVIWSVGCGSITAGGLYTANGPVNTRCTVEGTAASGTKYHVYGYDHAISAVGPLTVSPKTATVSEGATQQFTPSASATWKASCGSVSSAGLYTAPLLAEACTVTATPTAGGSVASATVTVSSPITIMPANAATSQSWTQQFTASAPVTWATSCGSISSAGLFRASGTQGAVCSITATAASGTAYTATATDTIGPPNTFTISPTNPAVSEAATQQFTASASATWATNCGTVSAAGLYTASLTAGSCAVTASSTGSSQTAMATVTVNSPITITPSSATTSQSWTQQFTASAPVTWTASCGSISNSGLFTASGTAGAICSIQATAASGTAYTATASDTIGPPNTFTISPANPAVSEGATQQFTANAAATWSTTCGAVTSAGLYSAPLTAGSCAVTASSTGSSQTAMATVTVSSPITITPSNATTPQNSNQQFTASAPVTWTASCGSISSSGLFTASGTAGAACSIQATAASGTAYTATASDTIAPPNAFAISPTSAAVSEGATQQFTANATATWSTTCGMVDGSGLYTAPLISETCTVTATPTAGGSSATATATVSSPITITPSSATTPQSSNQQFTASAPVTWTASCGSISTSGLFTASGTAGAICSIQATAASGTAYTATASDTIGPAAAFTVSPTSAAVSEGATQQFTANASATWVASCGSVTSAGLYTAPLTVGSCTVTATSMSDGSTALVTVTVSSPVTISPAMVNLHALNMQTFTASAPVAWTTSCGAISSSGVFTAPTAAGSCTLTATASSGTAYTAVATANVDVVNYTAWKGGGGNTGAQTDELALTPANVNSSSFGINWSAGVDGWVTAQPLYMNGLMINGVAHNVVFVATNNDSVYAFDGDTGAQLWQVSLIPAEATAVPASAVGFTSGLTEIGILGTPVIDPSTNTIYVVSETSEQNATYFPHRLHALDATTGNEKFGGPVLISNPQMAPMHKLQRTGLTLANGTIYLGIGSMQDMKPYNGLLFAFSAASLVQQAVWVVTPTGSEGGIWMGGAAPAVDENGDIYVATGNGTFDGSTNYGEAAVKLSPGLQVLDYFAPYNYAALVAVDGDLGSGDVMVVPDQIGSYPHELIMCGKPTPVYVLDRDNMGQVGTTSDNVIQRLDDEVGQMGTGTTLYACYTAPAMWGQNVYFGGKWDVLKMFTLNASTGMLSSSPVSQDTLSFGYPGADPVVSANGATNGIVWTIDTGTNTLRANDATNVANLFYSGSIPQGTIRWTIPTVVNGHVYVAEEGTVFAFGLTQQ